MTSGSMVAVNTDDLITLLDHLIIMKSEMSPEMWALYEEVNDLGGSVLHFILPVQLFRNMLKMQKNPPGANITYYPSWTIPPSSADKGT